MEGVTETPLKCHVKSENIVPELKTPPHKMNLQEETNFNSRDSGSDLKKDSTPRFCQSENTVPEQKTPPLQMNRREEINQNSQDSGYESKKNSTPDRLKVPKAFKYPERYRSPTDSMMSPVSKGLLARNKKGGGSLLPPTLSQPKIQELRFGKVGLFQN